MAGAGPLGDCAASAPAGTEALEFSGGARIANLTGARARGVPLVVGVPDGAVGFAMAVGVAVAGAAGGGG